MASSRGVPAKNHEAEMALLRRARQGEPAREQLLLAAPPMAPGQRAFPSLPLCSETKVILGCCGWWEWGNGGSLGKS